MFYRMANEHPQLWGRNGPRKSIKAQTRLDRIRWHLILLWNAPEKTIQKSLGNDAGYDDLGTSARVKRYLTNRWTKQLRNYYDKSSSSTSLEDGGLGDDSSMLDEKIDIDVVEVQSTHSAPPVQSNRLAVPYTAMEPMTINESQPQSGSRPGSAPGQRPLNRRSRSSGRASGIMVEEEPAEWLKDYNTSNMGKTRFY